MTRERSKKLYNKAKDLLPGGVSSPVRAINPYPFYTKSADGCILIDIDDNRYIDYCMGYGPLLLGHNHPDIKEAIRNQLDDGWLYGTPTEMEVELSQNICNNYPSIDMVRFVSTGTEATMGAIRTARGYTGKDKIIKIEGGFHGAHDAVLIKAGSGATTLGTPDSKGIPGEFTEHTLQVPFNDIDSMTRAIDSYPDEIAAVIIEPVMGNIGPILPVEGFLKDVRRVTEDNDIILIFDEVITGFRLAMGGAQEYYGVTPDMTTLGKIIGGGLPIGVIGGKKEIMEHISPAGEVYQAGTFNGHPLSLASALATLDVIKRDQIHKKVNEMGDRLRTMLRETVNDLSLDYYVSGVGSMFKVFFGELPSNYIEALQCDKVGYFDFFHRMLNDGIFLPPSQFETNFLSAAHTDENLDATINAYEKNLRP